MKTQRIKITGKDTKRVAYLLIALDNKFTYEHGEVFIESSCVSKIEKYLSDKGFKGEINIDLVQSL